MGPMSASHWQPCSLNYRLSHEIFVNSLNLCTCRWHVFGALQKPGIPLRMSVYRMKNSLQVFPSEALPGTNKRQA